MTKDWVEDLNDEHMVTTSAGVESTRSVRRLPVSQQVGVMFLENCRGSPWNRKEGVPPGYVLPAPVVGPPSRDVHERSGGFMVSGWYTEHQANGKFIDLLSSESCGQAVWKQHSLSASPPRNLWSVEAEAAPRAGPRSLQWCTEGGWAEVTAARGS